MSVCPGREELEDVRRGDEEEVKKREEEFTEGREWKERGGKDIPI